MAGLCGVVGAQRGAITDLANAINTFGDQRESLFRDDLLELGYVDHAVAFDEQPATTKNVSIWCWGDILGHEHRGKYTPRSGNLSDAEYCASLYETYGLNFVAGLNSEFSGVIYDHESETVSLFTDRLGSRPVYYTRTPDGSLVFSSLLQSLAAHPEVGLEANPEFLAEFLAFSHVSGVETPAKGVEEIPPGSILTFDTEGKIVDSWRYWWPVPTERKSSYSEFVDEFSEVFVDAVRDRSDQKRYQGILLSGGSDSRLLLASIEDDVTAFHMNEQLDGNKEAQTAQQVANKLSQSFKFLERTEDYYPGVFSMVGEITNFNGLPRHAHPTGFTDKISNQVEQLYCAQYSDTILSGTYVPKESISYPLLNHLYPSSSPRKIRSPEAYFDAISSGEVGDYNCPLPYLTDELNPRETLLERVEEKESSIQNSGVKYQSWNAMIEFGMIHPITNVKTFIFYETLNQMLPTKYPFLDNRIVDLALQMPSSYRYKRDIVETSLSELNPELASIPHPGHGLPLHYPYYIKHYVGKAAALRNKVERAVASSETEDSIGGGGGSWPNHETLVRQHSFVRDILEKNEDRIRASPYLDYDAAQDCYTAHLNGENYTQQLYALITVLESSIDLNSA
ncbi:Asparagine synthase (glutamine-hydrolyzing) [Halalkaliarchaeum sp. AArc-CO]|uniref:asparagine synthase-related protein n=1 Tax=Halalkaliarchaeum sp. AArc-CO TaxID=2866381 RepID=UPI00217DB88C|nr:asparagine synthase-related protein [Halalkaliarchaeum sp. AArc-CO]UWG52003.1 Asparagine synthase (glutamine-hydrolyzing) [Halalkaliarchaeum sp. AArc-CO]